MIVTGQRIDKRQDAEHSACYIANVANTGYAIGDRLIKVLYHDTVTSSVTFVRYNDTTDTVLTVAPVMGNLRSCDDKLDVEVTEQVHTDTATGEITPLIQHIVYNGQGVEVSRFYTDMSSSSVFTVTGIVADEAVRVLTGSQVVAFDDTAAVALTVPPFTAWAHIQNHMGVDAKVTTSGTAPATGYNGVGTVVYETQNVVLHSAIEVNNFQVIAVDNTGAGELYVEYWNTSIETGI